MPTKLIVPNTARAIDYHGVYRRVRVQEYAQSSVVSVQWVAPSGLRGVGSLRGWKPVYRGPSREADAMAERLAEVIDAYSRAVGLRPPAAVEN